MQDKIIKAYRTAWRWPEVYSSSHAVIWTSRALAFLVPLGLVALTLFTGIPVFGWLGTGILVGLLAGVLIFVTVKMFYDEFDTVEDFEDREERVKRFFHGFPAITDIPVIENEPNEWVAYGHVEPQAFVTAIQTIIREVTDDDALVEAYSGLDASVGHLYASFINPTEGHWSEGIEMCKPTGEGCFPITRVTKENQ